MWIEFASQNIESNEFPDFLFDGGFIEHFEVTSSYEGKKGSKQKGESFKLKANIKRELCSKLQEKPVGKVIERSAYKHLEDHSYSNICKSIKRNWTNHINSYDNYPSMKKHYVFLLEYTDFSLQTAIVNKDSPAMIYDSYRISADKELLKWIYGFKDKIEYLILFHEESLEVIKIDKIKKIIDGLPSARFESVIGIEKSTHIGWKQK